MWELLKTFDKAANLANYPTYEEIKKSYVGPGWYWLEGSRDSGYFKICTPGKILKQLMDIVLECKNYVKYNKEISSYGVAK